VKSLIVAAFITSAVVMNAHAQTVYKSTMPDGKVIYSEKPTTGAKRVDEITPPPPKTGMTTLTPNETARIEQQARERTKEGANAPNLQTQLDDARRQLKQAETGREAAKEPLPGERTGLVGGGSRLNEAYEQRQKSLDAALEAARKRVNDLQSGQPATSGPPAGVAR
jgi:chromosome segregation ATPase